MHQNGKSHGIPLLYEGLLWIVMWQPSTRSFSEGVPAEGSRGVALKPTPPKTLILEP